MTELINKTESAGFHSLKFDGSGLVSGIYFCSLFIDGKIFSINKMILLK